MNTKQPMKILHTADWHLGQKFRGNLDRTDEHRRMLNWLAAVIKEEEVDVLLVSGDIFDTPNPQNQSRRLYYEFLRDVTAQGLQHIVITGGNHDSPSMLNAPREILETLNIHVVGCATGDIEDEIIVLRDDKEIPQAVVAAVPFLRDRDLKAAISGESADERIDRIKAGIKIHYQKAAEAMDNYKEDGIPLLAMGHLYATGATASDRQDNIYIGDTENISAADFPELFDYVALGHLHRAQPVGGKRHIRYSGSLIPMSFAEWKDDKSVSFIQFEGKEIKDIKILKSPETRRWVKIHADEKTAEKKLLKLLGELQSEVGASEAWVEILLKEENVRPDAYVHFNDLVGTFPGMRILAVRYDRTSRSLDTLSESEDLDDLQPAEVFSKRCESESWEEKAVKRVSVTFKELLNWMEDEENRPEA